MVRCGGFHGFTGLPRDVHHQTHRKSYEPQSEDPEEDKEGDGVDGGGVAHGGGQEADQEGDPATVAAVVLAKRPAPFTSATYWPLIWLRLF